MGIREGLSFSDYFDDQVPYEVKPPSWGGRLGEEELRNYGEDYPLRSKDLFKGLQEGSRILVSGSNYWLDPQSNFHNVDIDGHARWARNYMDEHGIDYDKHDSPYYRMFELGFIRIRTNDEFLFFQYGKFKQPTNQQIRTLKDSAIETHLELYDDVHGMSVPLTESSTLDVKSTGRTLFIESMMPDDLDTFKSHLGSLFAYLQKELQLKTIPKVKLVSDDKNAAKVLGKTAYYDPDTRTIVLFTTDRHQKDVLRSFSHEVIHHWQH